MNIGFIGAGKVGKALGLYFRRHGLELSGYCSRTEASAHTAAALTGSGVFPDLETLARCSDVIFLTVPDLALEEVDGSAAALVGENRVSAGLCWLHVSGALASGCLARLRALGCPVGSMHPLQSFGDPAESAGRLNRAVFSIEGTEEAVGIMSLILAKTGGNLSRIRSEQKPLYHAGACVLSNYLVTLLDSGLRYFEAAGMEREQVIAAVDPLIEATLANVREKGTVDALTGPIVRGDLNTLRVHLQALEDQLPSELGLYRVMAEKTVRMIAEKRITKQQENSLLKRLEEGGSYER